MRDLLNFIFSNIVPILVVVSIAIRIIGGLKGGARKRQQAQGPGNLFEEEKPVGEEEYVEVWDRLKPDAEDGSQPGLAQGKGPGVARDPSGVRLPAGEIRPLLMPAYSGAPAFPQPRAAPPPLSPVPLFTPELLPSKPEGPEAPSLAPELSLSGPAAPPVEAETRRPAPGAPFPRRIENLSPLRRAVILAEILKPPRGLSNFPAE
jgi:hypothetical protein